MKKQKQLDFTDWTLSDLIDEIIACMRYDMQDNDITEYEAKIELWKKTRSWLEKLLTELYEK